ncbi:MAG: MATE family efflux transporter [Odoribacteraceae bacterium]|jgi:MATE family multidrug resistance protein|nr:MATE family efflux transporter [Odoribacteraceae bacterium]
MTRYFQQHLPHYKDTLRLGLPIVLGQVGIVAVGFADSIMVGRHATSDLAAASFVNSLFNLPVLFGIGFSYGLTPLVGRLFGSGETARAGGVLRDSLVANGIVGVALSLLMGIVYLHVHEMGQPAGLLPLVRPYFLLQLASLIFMMGFNAFKQFSDGIRDTVTPMWIMLGGNALNVLGNLVLIYGHAGIPALGLTGAGIATLSSRVAVLVAFVIVFYRRGRYRPYREAFRARSPGRSSFRVLGKTGAMIGAQMGMETALFSLTGVMVGWLGAVELAAHQVVVTLSMLGFMIYYGVGAAVSVRVSHFLGRGDVRGARRATRAGFHLILTLALVVALFFLASREWIGYLFTGTAEVVARVSTLTIIMAIYQFGDGLQIVYANSLRGISDVTPMALLSFVGYFLVALPVAYLAGFTFGGGLVGIWIAYPVGLTGAGLMFRARYLRSLRRLAPGP